MIVQYVSLFGKKTSKFVPSTMAKYNWDFVGMGTSILCAIHCAFFPILGSFSSFFSTITWLESPLFEWGMIVIAIAIGIYALWHGFAKHHKNRWPLGLFCVGSCFLIGKQFFHQDKLMLLLLFPAVIFLLTAHFINYRLSKRSGVCKSEHHKH